MSIIQQKIVLDQLAQHGYNVGDYVKATHAEYDDFGDETFVVTGFSKSLLGRALVKVRTLAQRDQGTLPHVFYPHELSFEDGSRPQR